MYQNHREIPSPLQALWDILDEHAATTPSIGRMTVRATAFFAVTAILLGPYAVAGLASRHLRRPIAKLWFRMCIGICGLEVVVKGTPSTAAATLYASNHVSYLDIIVLGALTDARFVAKSEVAHWPLFGLLAKLANTVFVTRDWRRAAHDSGALECEIAKGERLILFPEGTSSNGRTVLPFRTALFAAVDPSRVDAATTVQPVSIAYAGYADGRPLTGLLTDLYAWYGDMTLFGHLMTVFGLKGARLEVTFMAPMTPASFTDRKALASAAERVVRHGLQTSLNG